MSAKGTSFSLGQGDESLPGTVLHFDSFKCQFWVFWVNIRQEIE